MANRKKDRDLKERPISNGLREAIDQEESRYRVAKESGVEESQLSRFMAGRTLTLAVADRIAKALGISLRQTRRRKKRD